MSRVQRNFRICQEAAHIQLLEERPSSKGNIIMCVLMCSGYMCGCMCTHVEPTGLVAIPQVLSTFFL